MLPQLVCFDQIGHIWVIVIINLIFGRVGLLAKPLIDIFLI